MLEQDEQRDELLKKIEDLISRKRYAELRDLLLPLEAQDIAGDRKSTRQNSSHIRRGRMPSSA